MDYYDLKAEILKKIRKNGGWVNSHAHFDRAYTINKDNFEKTQVFFQEKWKMNREIIKNSSVDEIYKRMSKAVEKMIEQGVYAVGTFIDVYADAEDKSIKASQKVREKYKDDIILKFISQPLAGLQDKENLEWFQRAAEFVDIIGGLPSKDIGFEKEHLDIVMATAKDHGKMVHCHIDQLNSSDEKESEMFIRKTVEHGMQGETVIVHGVSIAAHAKQYRQRIYKMMKDNEVMIISNPSAYIDYSRDETLVPFHNAMTPVDELVPEGITVSIGTDNIADLHKPFTDGDMWTELRFMLEACRFYNIDELVRIATTNGRKVLGLD